MAIGPSAFRYVSTTTPGKLKVINWQSNIVSKAYQNQRFSGRGISLPGHHSQLERHIKELHDYGIAEHNQIMVDWDRSIYHALSLEAARIGFKGKVVHGDLTEVAEVLWEDGEQVDVIDFDGIGLMGFRDLHFLEKACDRDVKVFIGVFATRGNSGGLTYFQNYMKDKLNIDGYYHRRGNWTYSLRDIQGQSMQHVAQQKGYKCRYVGYQGLSTMVSCVVTK